MIAKAYIHKQTKTGHLALFLFVIALVAGCARDDGPVLHRIELLTDRPALIIANRAGEDLDVGGHLSAVVRQDLFAIGHPTTTKGMGDEAELEKRRILDELLDPLGIVHAG